MDEREILSRIEEKILFRLEEKGLDVKAFEVKEERDKQITTPAALCFIESGKATKGTTFNSRKVEVDVYVLLIFKSLKAIHAEKDRRRGVYPLIMGVLQYLTGQDLGLQITKLRPEGFRNITNQDDIRKARMVWQIHLKTSFEITRTDDGEATAGDLMTVGLKYFLQDPSDDGQEDAEDEVTRNQ
jgi:hypothetical protein